MQRIGITGHMNLSPESVDLVRAAIDSFLEQHAEEGFTGVSCLAAGADTIFATAVVELGADLEVVLPAADYRERKVKPDHAPVFDALLAKATAVTVLDHAQSNRAAYEAANEYVLSTCDQLVAVWDGAPAVDQGGTGAVVSLARARDMTIEIIWPEGATRV